MAGLSGQNECQVFSGLCPEGEESESQWRECQKNPGHLDFLPAPDFVENYLPRVQDGGRRKRIRSCLDLTVRLRVGYTSRARPDGFTFSNIRGTNVLRVGTGFIKNVWGPKDNKPCECHGRKQWRFHVFTALHVVYDNDEALRTVVDVFYDDKESHTDGRMKSVRGVEVLWSNPDSDVCYMTCVTCDEYLGERIESAWRSYRDTSIDVEVSGNILEELGLHQSSVKDYDPVLIVSHPHGQPKQVTVGQLTYEAEDENKLKQYTTPTCPGSSGAPVFVLDRKLNWLYLYRSVHSGSCKETCPEPCESLSKRLFNKLRGQKQPEPCERLSLRKRLFNKLRGQKQSEPCERLSLRKRLFNKLSGHKQPSSSGEQLNYGHWKCCDTNNSNLE